MSKDKKETLKKSKLLGECIENFFSIFSEKDWDNWIEGNINLNDVWEKNYATPFEKEEMKNLKQKSKNAKKKS